ncbi:hypothetical protein BDV93DRAFT_273277 [Ceratobasidium sp. AG-I]|nr:hypothetical protein BDV93DRAFT_273277 [Ceratobasidium sp. AG-I]
MSLSQATFQSLLPSIVAILQATQPPAVPHNAAGLHAQRQEIAKATMALRGQVADARDIVDALPGGEMLLEHQQEVITMLIQMRDARRTQLARLSDLSLGSSDSQQS